jgi:protein CpxP
MVFKFQHRLAATAMLAALALPALAQPAPATPPAAGATAQQAQPRADHRERRLAHMATRMAALKEQLKLTPAQESAWTTYAAALQPGERGARLDRKDMDQLTTPERIDRMRALRAQHAAEADRRGEATKAFYATLTPEQQKTFDAQTRHGHRMGGMKGPGEGRHGHHGHHGMRGGPGQPQQQQLQQPAAPAK